MNFYAKLGIWIVVVGGLFAFLWKQGYLTRLANYFAETREEMRKCNWPTSNELWETTVLIFLVIGALGFFTLGVDFVILKLVRLMVAA